MAGIDGLTIGTFLQYLSSAGVTGLLVFVIVGGFRGWWVYKRELDAIIEERDEWRRLALMGSDIAQRAVSLGSELVK